jgi:hypothetical protein
MPFYAVIDSVNPLSFHVKKWEPDGPTYILMPNPLHSQPVLVTFSDGSLALITSEINGMINSIIPVIGQDSDLTKKFPVQVAVVRLPRIHRQDALTNRISELIFTRQPLSQY